MYVWWVNNPFRGKGTPLQHFVTGPQVVKSALDTNNGNFLQYNHLPLLYLPGLSRQM
jgi:hypothetical protein